jgi:hypothetical protein
MIVATGRLRCKDASDLCRLPPSVTRGAAAGPIWAFRRRG